MDKVGYIKLYRSLTDNEIYMLPPLYLRVFERLVLEANHQDKEIPYKKNGVVSTKLIKRGERLTSIRQISEWVGWYERGVLKNPNPKLIKEILDYMVKSEMIIIYNSEGNRTETHYKVVNYEVYQDREDLKVTEQKQSRNKVETKWKRLALQNKNDKNDKNDKKISTAEEIPTNYLEFFNNNFHLITPMELDVLRSFEKDGLEAGVITLALMQAVEGDARNMKYVKAVLHRWLQGNIKTVDAVKADKAEHERKKSSTAGNKNSKGGKVDTFNNYEQRTYDFDDLEKRLLGWANEEVKEG